MAPLLGPASLAASWCPGRRTRASGGCWLGRDDNRCRASSASRVASSAFRSSSRSRPASSAITSNRSMPKQISASSAAPARDAANMSFSRHTRIFVPVLALNATVIFSPTRAGSRTCHRAIATHGHAGGRSSLERGAEPLRTRAELRKRESNTLHRKAVRQESSEIYKDHRNDSKLGFPGAVDDAAPPGARCRRPQILAEPAMSGAGARTATAALA